MKNKTFLWVALLLFLSGMVLFINLHINSNKKDFKKEQRPFVKDSVEKKKIEIIPEIEEEEIQVEGMEIPLTKNSRSIVHHFAYSLLYSEAHEQALWVAYELTSKETESIYERSNKFLSDPLVSSGSAVNNDYKGSGYDRGHLAPAGDMGWSSKSMIESFYYSNMSPQDPSFNRGIWKKLESLVRSWAIDYDHIYIVTGPILTTNLEEIGPNGVDIPKYYYKVILDDTGKDKKAIGFIIPNEGSKVGLSNFAVTVDEVEKSTGIDFFPLLNDEIENKLESEKCIPCWDWYVPKTRRQRSSSNNVSLATQCLGTTLAGNRCKRRTKNSNGYCFQHQH